MPHLPKVPSEVKNAIKDKYAWPGGYPLYLLTSNCETLCVTCGKKEYKQIVYSTRHTLNDGWRVVAADINWEDPDLYCCHCNARIESAYAEERE